MKGIIIDCDPGIDDALAIIIAINSKLFNIKGITTVHGNSPVYKTCKNALRLLEYLNVEIPVVLGAEKPLELEPMDLKIETEGKFTRGVCVPELRKRIQPAYNVEVAFDIKTNEFLDYFLKTIAI